MRGRPGTSHEALQQYSCLRVPDGAVDASLSLTRDPQTGLLTGSTLGSVTDSRSYTSYGELDTYSAAYPAGLSFQDQYTRDAAGRIIQKVETINGTETTYGYSYDQDGRLTDVTVNGSAYSHYG